jgi:hypothetical protein
MPEQKIWRFVGDSREDRLLTLVELLWNQLTPAQQQDLTPHMERLGMGWAIPTWECRNDADRLTLEQLAFELGMTEAGVRNWQYRYGLKPGKDGMFRWGDYQDMQNERDQQKRRKHAG